MYLPKIKKHRGKFKKLQYRQKRKTIKFNKLVKNIKQFLNDQHEAILHAAEEHLRNYEFPPPIDPEFDKFMTELNKDFNLGACIPSNLIKGINPFKHHGDNNHE